MTSGESMEVKTSSSFAYPGPARPVTGRSDRLRSPAVPTPAGRVARQKRGR